jgi:hypothetical protein
MKEEGSPPGRGEGWVYRRKMKNKGIKNIRMKNKRIKKSEL